MISVNLVKFGPHLPRPPPPPPTQYYLGYAHACSLPLKAPPYLRTDNISEPPFRGLFAGFSCLGDPLNPKHCSMYPTYVLFYNPLFKFLRRPKRERKKTHPIFKINHRVKVKYHPPPPFFYTILGPDFVARKVHLYRRFWEHACGPSDPGVGAGTFAVRFFGHLYRRSESAT